MGVLLDWWLGGEDGRVDEPYVSPSRWSIELIQADFGALDTTVFDRTEPYHVNATMVVRPASHSSARKVVTLLCDDERSMLTSNVKDALSAHDYEVSISNP